VVRGRDLSGNAPDVVSTFDLPPHPEYYTYLTNDHDLLALNDGSVLYLTGAGSKEPLPTKPIWFDVTFRGSFGPGARSILMVWRSTDCGKSFQYVSRMDPALVEDGSCANPQPIKSPTPPQAFDMGGSDGQMVKADPSNDNLFLTFKCVGSNIATVKGKPTLTTPLNKTLVMVSTNKGTSWSSLGFMQNVAWWRFGTVPIAPTTVAFGFLNDVVFGSGPLTGKFTFSGAEATPSGAFGWTKGNWLAYNQSPRPVPTVGANVVANTLIARAGDSTNLILAFPSDQTNQYGSDLVGGYRLFFYDPKQHTFVEGLPILPVANSSANCIMHLTAIDFGQGPVLLYWHDIDGLGKKAKIRGRFVTGSGGHTSDFDIAGPLDLTTPPGGYFYGDYHTASGFQTPRAKLTPITVASPSHFFPAWVQRDGTLHFVEIVAGESTAIAVLVGGPSKTIPGHRLPPIQTNVTVIPPNWKPGPSPVELPNYRTMLPQVRETPEVEAIKPGYRK
jgi:hypothetical protein